jgi:group I intron endonuclease
MTIYLLTNRINGKYYVGQTVQCLHRRLRVHRDVAPLKRGPLQCAIQKYGMDAFDVDILAETDNIEHLNLLETLWIVALRANEPGIGYNCNTGGNNKRFNPESRRKMSESHVGKTLSAEQVTKMVAANTGRKRAPDAIARITQGARSRRKLTPEARQRWIAALKTHSPWNKGRTGVRSGRPKGYHLTDEHKAKIGAAHKGLRPTPEQRKRMSDAHRGIPTGRSWNRGLTGLKRTVPTGGNLTDQTRAASEVVSTTKDREEIYA